MVIPEKFRKKRKIVIIREYFVVHMFTRAQKTVNVVRVTRGMLAVLVLDIFYSNFSGGFISTDFTNEEDHRL